MLNELRVINFALIEDIHLTFGAHLNVLSGETGAGKSIIVDAMKLLLGARATSKDIRIGATKAVIEGVFDPDIDNDIWKELDEMGLEKDILVLSRELNSSGKNTCRINHRVVSLSQFRELATKLVNIFGQHDHQNLSDPAQQLALLDSLGQKEHCNLLQETAANYRLVRRSARRLKQHMTVCREEEKKIKTAEKELESLLPLQLKKGEETAVAQRYELLTKRRFLRDKVLTAYGLIYGDADNCQSRLSQAIDCLTEASQVDDKLALLLPELNSALISLQEAAHTLGNYDEEGNEGEQEALSRRLSVFSKLRRRYQMSIDELVEQIEQWQALADNVFHSQQALEDLQKRYLEDKSAFETVALKLRASRKQLAQQLENRLLIELADLSMPHARFDVAFQETGGSLNGMDDVIFLLAPNPGFKPEPLHSIASGGEMSRIMLAFKTILTSKHNMDTLIFDEIDTGIGGITLNAVADKLAMVAQKEQVICVTHAAPIAAKGDRNFFILKETDGETTHIRAYALAEAEVEKELARMLGGHDEWHLAYAKKLREAAKENLDF